MRRHTLDIEPAREPLGLHGDVAGFLIHTSEDYAFAVSELGFSPMDGTLGQCLPLEDGSLIIVNVHDCLCGGTSPNIVALHELVHARQIEQHGPSGQVQLATFEQAIYGYWDAPYEVEARAVADNLHTQGVTVLRPHPRRFR